MTDFPNSDHGQGGERTEVQGDTQHEDSEQSTEPLNKPNLLKVIKGKLAEAKRNIRAGEKYHDFKGAVQHGFITSLPHLRRWYILTERNLERWGGLAADFIDARVDDPIRSALHATYRCISRPAWAMVLVTVVIAITTALQWDAIRKQNAEFIRQTDTMIEQNQLARDQLIVAQKTTEQTQTIIDRTAKEQRAWIAAGNPRLDTFEEGKTPVVSVVISNTGKTPGYIMGSVMDIMIGANDDRIPLAHATQLKSASSESRENTIAAGGGIQTVSSEEWTLDEQTYNAIKSGDMLLFAFGVIIYRDVFGVVHDTRYCFVYNHERDQLLLNRRHQYMDDR